MTVTVWVFTTAGAADDVIQIKVGDRPAEVFMASARAAAPDSGDDR